MLKRKRTNVVFGVLLAIFLILLVAMPVLAYAYSATFTITETASTAHTMLPVIVESPNTYLAANGYMEADALDTRIVSAAGTEYPHLITDDTIISVIPSVGADSQTNILFTMGNTDLSAMYIVRGENGLVRVADNAAMEPGTNYEIEIKGYFDTSSTTNILTKEVALGSGTYRLRIFTSAADTISVSIQGGWQLDATVTTGVHIIKHTHDGTTAKLFIDGNLEDSTLTGTGVVDSTEPWMAMQGATSKYWYYWKHTVGGTLIAHYEPIAIIAITDDAGAATGGSVNQITDAAGGWGANAWKFATATIITTTDGLAPQGETRFVVSSNATELVVTGDAFSVAPENGDTYYVSYGTLADREGAAQNGLLSWGSGNPAGVTTSLGGLVSIDQPGLGDTVDTPTIDILPVVEGSDWFIEPAVATSLLTNPVRPFITMLSDNTSMTEIQAWRILGAAMVIIVLVATARAVSSHLLICGIATSAAIGLMVQQTIFPMWALVFIIPAVLAGIIAERSPSV